MKFIHTSDIHYGIIPDPDRNWSRERENAVRSAFDRIIEVCSREKPELLLICGDMFHGQPTSSELDLINRQFGSIPDTRIVVIAGEDDYIIPRSPVSTYAWADNVTYVTDSDITPVCFDDINTVVYARSCNSGRSGNGYIDKLPETDPDRINILMVYGGDGDRLPYDSNALESAGFSYAALGGMHKTTVMQNAGIMAVYPGSPEPMCSRDTGEHGFYVCEIERSHPGRCTARFEPVSSIRYSTLAVNVTPNTTNDDVISSLRSEMTRRGRSNIYKLRLLGLCDPEISFDLGDLHREFRISEITDETEPKFDYGKLFAEHPSDLIGLFIQKFNRPGMSEPDRKALAYGVRALLQTSDEGKQD